MADLVAQQLDEKCKVLETLSKCQQEVGALPSNQTASNSCATVVRVIKIRVFLI